MVYEYDSDLHTQMLLKGAPAIITSSIKSEDYASAKVFSNFYELIEDGIDVETALHMSKKNYLECQQGENCNPYRWNAYRVISQRKIVPFTPLSWWEEIWQFLSTLKYLFSPPPVE